MSDNKEFMSLLKNDLTDLLRTVFTVSLTGDVKHFKRFTLVDFAYSVHSANGNKMVGARVNGKLVRLNMRSKRRPY